LPFVRRFPFDNDELWRPWPRELVDAAPDGAHAGFPDDDFEAYRVSLADEDLAARRELHSAPGGVQLGRTRAITQGPWTKVLPRDKMTRIRPGPEDVLAAVVLLGAKDDARIDGVDIDTARGDLDPRGSRRAARRRRYWARGRPDESRPRMQTRSVGRLRSTPRSSSRSAPTSTCCRRRCGGCWWTTPSYFTSAPGCR